MFMHKDVKAKALSLNLLWTRVVGFNLQIVEFDVLIMVQSLKNNSLYRYKFGNLLLHVPR